MVLTRRKRTASKISAEIEPVLPPSQPKSKQQKKTTTTAPSRTSSRRAVQPQPDPEPEADPDPEPESPDDLKTRLRNNWKFAATWQFFFNFSEAFKLKEMPIETFEDELSGVFACETVRKCICAVLSFLTSGKVAPEEVDEVARRQWRYKLMNSGPYGDEEEPKKFTEFDLDTKLDVLHQLTIWVMARSDKLRPLLPEDQKETDWRMEPCGKDAKDNSYYLLDDSRLYCLEPANIKIPATTAVKKSKGKKRQRVTPESEEILGNQVGRWSCVCVTLDDWRAFAGRFKKSKNEAEVALREYIVEELFPIFEAEEAKKEKARQDEIKKRELEALVANRKRSSRVEHKLAEKAEREAREAAAREVAEAARLKKAEEEKKKRILAAREKRLRARDDRIRKHRQQEAIRLARLQEQLAKEEERKKEIAAREKEREEIGRPTRKVTRRQEQSQTVHNESSWDFDCICGVHGKNYDDGSLSIMCDACEIWQHATCLHIKEVNKSEQFICERCKNKPPTPTPTPEPQPQQAEDHAIHLQLGVPNLATTGSTTASSVSGAITPAEQPGEPHGNVKDVVVGTDTGLHDESKPLESETGMSAPQPQARRFPPILPPGEPLPLPQPQQQHQQQQQQPATNGVTSCLPPQPLEHRPVNDTAI